MPKLPENFHYVIAGDGPDREDIVKAIAEKNLSSRVDILGYVTDKIRNILFNTADIFVQPNIKIVNDMEGFGISVIEASACERVVLASNLEGLKDAIKDGENGFLVKVKSVDSIVDAMEKMINLSSSSFIEMGKRSRQLAINKFDDKIVIDSYLKIIDKMS